MPITFDPNEDPDNVRELREETRRDLRAEAESRWPNPKSRVGKDRECLCGKCQFCQDAMDDYFNDERDRMADREWPPERED